MILVTGGAGFIGSNFVLDWLTGSAEPVINLDRLTYAGNRHNLDALARDPRHHFVVGDIANTELVSSLLAKHQPRAIVHFAAETHVDRSINGPADFVQTNIVGTSQLLDATLTYWRQLTPAAQAAFRFLHISTDEVYGSLEPDAPAFTEHHPYAPNNPYSASKAAADHLVRAYHHTYGLPVLTVHCSNNYGPFQFPEKLIPLCLHHALAGNPLPLYGNGLQVRDWLYVGDHCTALRRVLEAGRPGATYNIGGNSERTNLQVVQGLCALLDTLHPRPDGRSYCDQITFVPDRPGHDRRYALDTGLMRRELGWQPAQAFETGLAKTIKWYLDHPGWVRAATQHAGQLTS